MSTDKPTSQSKKHPDAPARRKFLLTGAAFAGTAAVAAAGAQTNEDVAPGSFPHTTPDDPTRQPGVPGGYNDGYGLRSPHEDELRRNFPMPPNQISGSWTPLKDSYGTVTPSGLHYEVHHNGIPIIDPTTYKLAIHGQVKEAKIFSLEDLMRFPSITRPGFLECAGNGFTELKKPTMPDVQGTHGLTSNSEWTGVPLKTVLNEVGVEKGASWILAEGSDAGMMTRSIPLEKALDDAMLAYAQNGEAIRPEQGYPLRLLLPGFEGNMSIKWLGRLELGDKPHYTHQEVTGYSDIIEGGKTRWLTFEMEAKSVITSPSGGMQLDGPGFYEITGLAWSGRGRITKVEISDNSGKSWREATLQKPVHTKSHTRFRIPWQWDGDNAVLQSRATDETGYVQPTLKALVDVRGSDSENHNNAIQSWAIDTDGKVTNVHV
jgi:sulfane dehydrogenase subunit SoxC